jgi:F-type H+-transporting ATPase subunit delta
MPLIESKPDAVATMYARSLFELAYEQGGQERSESIGGEIEDIVELARSNASFSEFLASRVLGVEARDESLRKIFGGRTSPLVLHFLQLLNRKGRLNHLPPIVAAYDQIVQEHFGRIEVDVLTATPIDDQQLSLIREKLSAALGKQPVLHPYTDASMLGGLKLRIGDQLVDASVATRLANMRQRLINRGGATIRGRAAELLDETNAAGE